MPKKNERQQLLEELVDVLAVAVLEEDDDEDISCDDRDPYDDLFSPVDELSSLLACVTSSRFLSERQAIPKSSDFKLKVFPALPAEDFRLLTRISRTSFDMIVREIKHNPVFHNDSLNKQAPVWQQLAVVLDRLGSYVNDASVERISLMWGVSRGSVEKYTDRVLKALSDVASKFVRWPNKDERAVILSRMKKKGFPGCIGFIDETTIPLAQKPAVDGECVFDRKKWYSINAQVVCDDRRRAIAFYSGWPGSCGDSTVYKEMQIADDSKKRFFFDAEQYLLTDSAYPADLIHDTIVPSYKSNTLGSDIVEFNTCVAHARVVNEHTIGVIKNRFSGLKELRVQLNEKEDMERALLWMKGCVVLHNMLLDADDAWQDEDHSDDEDDSDGDEVQNDEDNGDYDEDTYAFRRKINPFVAERKYNDHVVGILGLCIGPIWRWLGPKRETFTTKTLYKPRIMKYLRKHRGFDR